jgi:hypothetical protein
MEILLFDYPATLVLDGPIRIQTVKRTIKAEVFRLRHYIAAEPIVNEITVGIAVYFQI